MSIRIQLCAYANREYRVLGTVPKIIGINRRDVIALGKTLEALKQTIRRIIRIMPEDDTRDALHH